MLTGDGRYVFFVSEATNLVANDSNGAFRTLFRHEVSTQQTVVVDVGLGAVAPQGIHVSGDGRHLAYFFGNWKIVDLQTGTTTDLPPGSACIN